MNTLTILDSIREEFTSWHGIDLTPEQTAELFGDQPDLHEEIEECGMDTGCREIASGILARKLVGRDWPIYKDGEEAGQQFLINLKAALEQRGIKHRFK